MIPPKPDRKTYIPCDLPLASSHRKLLLRSQELSPVATRYDKTDQSFAATIHLVAIVLALK
jgi:hypothetical protein